MLAVAMATLFAAASCSSIYRPDGEVDGKRPQNQMVQFEQTQNQIVENRVGSDDDDDDSSSSEEDSDEESDDSETLQERSLLSTFKTVSSLISSAANNTLQENILTAAGAVADVALTAVTGSEEGAALAKTAIGVVGEALEAVTAKLSNSSLSNNTLASALLNTTSAFGTLLSDYGDGNETVSTIVTLVESVTSGNVTLKSALTSAGISLIDSTLTPTKEKITIAGKAIVVVGGVIETVASSMSDSANSTCEEVIDEILTTIGAESIINSTFSVIDNILNITLEDIISEKLAEIDNSTATLKEKVLAVSEVIETVGETLVTIGGTAEDLGSSSVSDYASIIKTALSSLSTSSTTTSTDTSTSS